ncbi:MAG: MarR family transcriptional regulator [Cyclobacteriaceae bacterium]|nr:MarR family transcriptional regulator [Cyclobacteriaceae bacterium]
MTIEEAIKVKKFHNEFERLAINISYTASLIRSRHIQFFKGHGISPEQYNVLRILRGQYPRQSNVNLVQERMIDKMSNASRLIDKLVKKQLVERKQCEEDRRQADVLITRKGLDMLERIDGGLDSLNRSIFKCDEKEAERINEILNSIRD